MKNHAIDILTIVGGMFLYGIRNMVGKWLVNSTLALLNKLIKHTEHYVAAWLHRQQFRPHEIPKGCVKGKCFED